MRVCLQSPQHIRSSALIRNSPPPPRDAACDIYGAATVPRDRISRNAIGHAELRANAGFRRVRTAAATYAGAIRCDVYGGTALVRWKA